MFDVGYSGPPSHIERDYRKVKRSQARSFAFFVFGYSLLCFAVGFLGGVFIK